MLDGRLPGGARLRLPEQADAAALYETIDADREALALWLPWAARQTETETHAFVDAVRAQHQAGNGLQTVIEVDGRPVGMVGMHGVVWPHRSTSLGYWLASPFRGRGLVTAGVRAYLDYALGELGLNRVELQAAVGNDASRAVAERLGFQREGVRRQAEWVGDKCYDLVVHSMLAADWAQARRGRGDQP